MRSAVVAIAMCAVVPAAFAEPVRPLVVFYAPAPAPEARDALTELARARGTELIDESAAPPPPPQAALHLARGVAAYYEPDYQAARDHLDRGVAEAERTGAHGLTPAELSDLLVFRGLCYSALGDQARAWDEFVRAAVITPERRLDPGRFAPAVVAMFQRAAETVAAAPTAQLAIDVPSACTVHLDGRAHATGAGPTTVARGEHYVRVACPGHEPFGARVAVSLPTQIVRPELRALAPPDDARLAELARARAATHVLLALVAGDGAAATVTLRLIDVSDGRERERAIVRLDRGGPAIARAAEGVLDRAEPDRGLVPPPVTAKPRAWYESPWLWGAAGAAIATAVLLPLALRDDGGSGSFRISTTGDTPP